MKKAKILIVEDEPIVAEDLKKTIRNIGYEVVGHTINAKEAIKKAIELHPDLILMDIVLRGERNGIDASIEIKSRTGIPIIFLTAYSDIKLMDRAKATEPYGYIVKPFQERQVFASIEMALYKRVMEQKLSESEQWLSTTLRSIGDAVIATDIKGFVKFMNPITEALTGWKQEEALGKPLTEILNLINEETREKAEDPVKNVTRKGHIVDLPENMILISKDGTELPVADTCAPIRDEKGNLIGVVLVFRDITERKKAEEELKKLNETLEEKVIERTEELETLNEELQLQTDELQEQSAELLKVNDIMNQEIIQHKKAQERIEYLNRAIRFVTEQGLIITEMNGKIDFINPAFSKITGYTEEELIGTQIPYLQKNLYSEKVQEKLINKITEDNSIYKRIIFGKDVHYSKEYFIEMLKCFKNGIPWRKTLENVKKNNKKYTERNAIIQVCNNQGEVENYIILKDDISNEKILEQQLIHSQKLEVLSAISGGIAHDFNNILNIILSHSDFLLSENMDEKVKAGLSAIKISAEKGAKLIREMLSVGRRSESFKKQIELNKIIEYTIKMISQFFSRKFEIVIKLTKMCTPIFADPAQIEQVIMNICLNSKDAMLDGGKLTIKTGHVEFYNEMIFTNATINPGKYLVLSIQDTGTGISEEELANIFDPFFTTKEKKKGSGLGLSIVSRIVTDHQGGISVLSTRGKGTIFKIYFPYSDIIPKITSVKTIIEKKTEHEQLPLNILIVDDDQFITDLLHHALSKKKHKCLVGSNGREALEIFNKYHESLDLVLMDIVMPELSGLEALKEIRMIDSKIPIIMMSGSLVGEDQEKFIQEKSSIVVAKPLTVTKLFNIINSLQIKPKKIESSEPQKIKTKSKLETKEPSYLKSDKQLEFELNQNKKLIVFPIIILHKDVEKFEKALGDFIVQYKKEDLILDMTHSDDFSLPIEKLLLRTIILAKKYQNHLLIKATDHFQKEIKKCGYKVDFI